MSVDPRPPGPPPGTVPSRPGAWRGTRAARRRAVAALLVVAVIGGAGPAAAATDAADTTAPVLVLAAVGPTTVTTPALAATLSADEPIDCGTLDALDLVATEATLDAVAQQDANTCAIALTSTVATLATGTSTLDLAASFSVADASGNAAATASGAPLAWTVDRTGDAVPDTTPPTLVLSRDGPEASDGSWLVAVLDGDEPIACATLAPADLVGVAVASLDILQVTASRCRIEVASSVAPGAEGTTSIAPSASFSVTDTAGNAATAATGGPVSWRVDRRGASVLVGRSGAATTSGTALAFTVTADEAVDCTTLRPDGVVLTNATLGTVTQSGPTVCTVALEASVAAGSTGTVTAEAGMFDVWDLVGNGLLASSGLPLTWTVDRTPPTVSAPGLSLATAAALSGTATPVRLTLRGADDRGVASYAVARSTDGGITWTTVATPVAATVVVAAPTAGTVRFRVQAVDAAGNRSAWSAAVAVTARLAQQAALGTVYGGSWTSATGTAYSGGSERYARTAGASVAYTFTARQVGIVATTGPGRGRAKVYVNGVYVTTIDLYAAATRYRQVVWTRTWSTLGKRTVKLVVVGTAGRPRVDVDAFVTAS